MAVDNVQIIGNRAIDEYALKAAESERKRSHLLLHGKPDDPVQRLLIVLHPGSYVRPHHRSQQWEMLVLLRDRAGLLHFDKDGRLHSRSEMSVDAAIAQIPRAEWHGFLLLEADTAVMEIKPGDLTRQTNSPTGRRPRAIGRCLQYRTGCRLPDPGKSGASDDYAAHRELNSSVAVQGPDLKQAIATVRRRPKMSTGSSPVRRSVLSSWWYTRRRA